MSCSRSGRTSRTRIRILPRFVRKTPPQTVGPAAYGVLSETAKTNARLGSA